MIIVEGPDGAGKSTLVKWICESFKLEEGQRLERNRDFIYRTTRLDSWVAIYKELQATEPPLVWDRLGPWSDPIYSSYMGRDCAFTERETTVVKGICRTLGCPVIVCLPPLEVVRTNVANSHQIKAATNYIDVIYKHYSRAGMVHPVIFYDYTKPKLTGLGLAINRYLNLRKEREALSC